MSGDPFPTPDAQHRTNPPHEGGGDSLLPRERDKRVLGNIGAGVVVGGALGMVLGMLAASPVLGAVIGGLVGLIAGALRAQR